MASIVKRGVIAEIMAKMAWQWLSMAAWLANNIRKAA